MGFIREHHPNTVILLLFSRDFPSSKEVADCLSRGESNSFPVYRTSKKQDRFVSRGQQLNPALGCPFFLIPCQKGQNMWVKYFDTQALTPPKTTKPPQEPDGRDTLRGSSFATIHQPSTSCPETCHGSGTKVSQGTRHLRVCFNMQTDRQRILKNQHTD